MPPSKLETLTEAAQKVLEIRAKAEQEIEALLKRALQGTEIEKK